MEEEKDSMLEELAKVKQDLFSEKSVVSRLSAEKVDLEQKLQVINFVSATKLFKFNLQVI